jgi:hypothetical protein
VPKRYFDLQGRVIPLEGEKMNAVGLYFAKSGETLRVLPPGHYRRIFSPAK